MTISFDTVSGRRVRVWSEGDGAPLLYLHGFEGHPGDASFLTRLARHHRVYAPEMPGYGASTGLESIDGVLGLTLHYRQLVEAWGTGPLDVIGHSLGGMFAAEFAAVCPHLTRRLVLVGAYGLWLDEIGVPDPFVLSPKELAAAKWSNPDNIAEPSIFTPDPADPDAAILERARNLAAATKFMWPIADRGLRHRAPLIGAPTLIIHGTEDGLIPSAYAAEFARLIPDSRIRIIDGAGHLPMVEREDAFLAVVEPFLSDQPGHLTVSSSTAIAPSLGPGARRNSSRTESSGS